jgi:XTP/dITP diphosphohydrolase
MRGRRPGAGKFGRVTEKTSTQTATGRIVLLTVSHRVAPGLLSWQAWETLRGADRVYCADPAHPQLPYVREAGVTVETVAPTAAELVDACPPGTTIVVIPAAADDTDTALTDGLARLAGSGRVQMPDLELLPGSYDLPGARLLDLVQVMDRVRRECPWTSTQTHKGLAKYGVEEMYELIEAIEDGDATEVREELGDVLLQVVLHARIAEDAYATDDADDASGAFSIDDVAATVVEKLIHRHPHIFGDETAETPQDVHALWERTKAVEKHHRTSVTDGIPLGQPALALAAKLASRARSARLSVELPTDDNALGYALLALAVEAESQGVDPETALRAAARTYRDAIRTRESARGGA